MYLKTRNYFFVLRYPYENISSNKKLLHEMRHFFLWKKWLFPVYMNIWYSFSLYNIELDRDCFMGIRCENKCFETTNKLVAAYPFWIWDNQFVGSFNYVFYSELLANSMSKLVNLVLSIFARLSKSLYQIWSCHWMERARRLLVDFRRELLRLQGLKNTSEILYEVARSLNKLEYTVNIIWIDM
jgi:hypothetical protein